MVFIRSKDNGTDPFMRSSSEAIIYLTARKVNYVSLGTRHASRAAWSRVSTDSNILHTSSWGGDSEVPLSCKLLLDRIEGVSSQTMVESQNERSGLSLTFVISFKPSIGVHFEAHFLSW